MKRLPLLTLLALITTSAAASPPSLKAIYDLEVRFAEGLAAPSDSEMIAVYGSDSESKSGLFIVQTTKAGSAASVDLVWVPLTGKIRLVDCDAEAVKWRDEFLTHHAAWQTRPSVRDLLLPVPASETARNDRLGELRKALEYCLKTVPDAERLELQHRTSGDWAAVVAWKPASQEARRGAAWLANHDRAIGLHVEHSRENDLRAFLREPRTHSAGDELTYIFGERGDIVWNHGRKSLDVRLRNAYAVLHPMLEASPSTWPGFVRASAHRIFDARQTLLWQEFPPVHNATPEELIASTVCQDHDGELGFTALIWLLK